MRRALALARRGWGQTAPNPMVGAVLVKDGVVVGEGFHAKFGAPHAEAMALAVAGDLARGATAYLTLEPCAHEGKTPPCADALIAAGVSRVVVAVADPNPVAQGGAKRLLAAGIAVEFGFEAEEALELNAPFFFAAANPPRPWITLKLAVSVDGAIASASREPRWLTGEAARHYVHRLRAVHDAVAVGVGTALADDPNLNVRHGRRPRVAPLRVVFDRTARLPADSQLARTARRSPTLVVAEQPEAGPVTALEQRGVVVLTTSGLADALRALVERGVRSMFVEGGAQLAQSLLAAGVVDRLIIFQAPVLLGPGALAAFVEAPSVDRFRVVERREFGDDLMAVYALNELPSVAAPT